MDDFYESQKVVAIKRAAEDVVTSIDDDTQLASCLSYWNVKEQLRIIIVDENGNILHASALDDIFISTYDTQTLQRYYQQVKEEGEVFEKNTISLSDLHDGMRNEPPHDKGHKRGEDADDLKPPNYPQGQKTAHSVKSYPTIGKTRGNPEEHDVVTYITIAESKMVLVSSVISPLDATISTLVLQFYVAVIVLLAFAFLVAWIFAGKIARPIDTLSEAAKLLPKGEYQSPKVGGYSEVKELCRTLDEVSVELRKIDQLQKDLIANVSHDLRTPLTMITGYSEAIRDFPDEDCAENIQVVIDEANRLTALVNDVLDLSKLQSGNQTLDMQEENLTHILESTVKRCETMISKGGYHIELQASQCVYVKCDGMRISQIIYNLLGNALSHTGDDKCVVIVQEVNDDKVRVSVKDSGSGISEEERKYIWQRYYRTGSEHHRRQEIGTGLGLSIVYNLVSLHGGICGVDSEIGKGSTFWFELPIMSVEA